MSTWRIGALGPFPRVARAQCTAPVAYGAPGPASAGHPCPLHYPGPPHGPLAYHGRLARCTHSAILTVRSHAPYPSTGLLHPSNWVSSLPPHQQQNDFHFVNLTNPLTHIKLTLGSLGRESLLPPITHRTMHSTFAPNTQTRWPHSLNMYHYTLNTHTSLNPDILLTTSPN